MTTIRMKTAFARAAERGTKALIPYLTAGFPTLEATQPVLDALVAGGADLIELGVPFSDPIADGPTIQRASTTALAAGTTTQWILQTVADFRRRHAEVPIVLFGAYNPFFFYGMEAFARDAAAAGVDALLIPDLPVDEGAEVQPVVEAAGLDLIYLAAPTTTPERKAMIAKQARGFIYYISLKGVTGARAQVAFNLEEPMAQFRALTDLPLAVGFGVSTPEQAATVARVADAVVVGSALIDVLEKAASAPVAEQAEAARAFMATIRAGIDGATATAATA